MKYIRAVIKRCGLGTLPAYYKDYGPTYFHRKIEEKQNPELFDYPTTCCIEMLQLVTALSIKLSFDTFFHDSFKQNI